MKRKFMMLFAFLLMTGFGLCSIDANNVKKENQNGMSDVVNDQKTFETEADKILKEVPVKNDKVKEDSQKNVEKQPEKSNTKENTVTTNTLTVKKQTNDGTKKQTITSIKQKDTTNKTNETPKKEVVNPPKQDTTVTKKEDTVKKEEPKKEVTSPKEIKPVNYNYDIGNCDKLYDSEAKAYAAAEDKFNDFSDPDKYVSNYMVYSTYDKWSINYYYEHY